MTSIRCLAANWVSLVGTLFLAVNLGANLGATSVQALSTLDPAVIMAMQADPLERFRHRPGGGVDDHARLHDHHPHRAHGLSGRELTTNSSNRNPLKITNMCPGAIWPGVITASGEGPGTGGFELAADHTVDLYVGSTWAGRIWGRTNCSFNDDGTGPSNANGVGGSGMSCLTGDCFGRLNCELSGAVPATIVEITLSGGEEGMQTFYDISLVDGYNLPMGVKYMAGENTSYIPPNLTNAACIATAGYLADPARTGVPGNSTMATNSSYPVPLEPTFTNEQTSRWCPWELQAYPPTKPGSGVYPYPDDEIERPVFDPCLSACAKTKKKQDCCTDEYNDPSRCEASLYSRMAKKVCPDAYSFAYDDTQSTFMIPKGGGWEVVFCPEGRSTDILHTFGEELEAVASSGGGDVSEEVRLKVENVTFMYEASGGGGGSGSSVWMAVVMAAAVVAGGVVF